MACNGNCPDCDCKKVKTTPEDRIQKLELALHTIIRISQDPEWSKTDIGRVVKEALRT